MTKFPLLIILLALLPGKANSLALPDEMDQRIDSLENMLRSRDSIIALSRLKLEESAAATEQLIKARPYIVKGVQLDAEILSRPYSSIDPDTLAQFCSSLTSLRTLDPRINDIHAQSTQVYDAMRIYTDAKRYIASSPYDIATNDRYLAQIDSLKSNNSANSLRIADLDSLSRRIKEYQGAIYRFDRIIVNVDNKIKEYVGVDANTGPLLLDEIGQIIDSNKEWIDMIDSYPVLKKMLSDYRVSLRKDPLAGAPEIKSLVSAQLNEEDDTDGEDENDGETESDTESPDHPEETPSTGSTPDQTQDISE